MGTPLRVLIVEDSEDDTLLLLRELRQGGLEVVSERVETPSGMGAALAEHTWDVVISDYSMPHFSAPAALRVLQDKGLDLPFIIVSGTVGEETAVAAMKAGAHDYLMKGNLTRLVAAVQREVREAEVRRERRRAEAALVARTRQLEAIRAVTAEITHELNLTSLLHLIVQRAAELVMAPSGCVFLWDEGVQRLIPRAWHGMGDWMGKLRLRLGEGVAGTVAQKRAGLIVNDYRASSHAHAPTLERTAITAVVAEPLLYRDRLVGVISINQERGERTFTGRDRELLALFADQAAIAIENAQLFAQVSRAKTEWEHTFDSIPDLVAVIDAEGRLARANRALAERLRVAPGGLVGKGCTAVLPCTDSTECPQEVTHEVEDPRLGGTFLVTRSPLRDPDGHLLGSVCIARDITVQKRLEEDSRQRQRFEDLSRAKSDFIATMSHELRTPLNSVIGFAELLLGQGTGPLNERQARYLGHIQQSGKHLLHLISDILDLSKIEAGKITLHFEALAVPATLEDFLVIARGLAHKKSQTIRADVSPDLPLFQADPVRFKQILFNLLSNAVKFTPEGGTVTVKARKVDQSPSQVVDSSRPVDQLATRPIDKDGEWLEIRVRDTGVGIRAEDIPRLFREFVQLEATRDSREEGTGLGLALTKHLVELHGGRIWVESEGEGKGSTFTVLLPIGDAGR
jgi:signal transduction histidine kinase